MNIIVDLIRHWIMNERTTAATQKPLAVVQVGAPSHRQGQHASRELDRFNLACYRKNRKGRSTRGDQLPLATRMKEDR